METHFMAFTIAYSTFECTPYYCAAGNVIVMVLQLANGILEQNICSWNDALLGTQFILLIYIAEIIYCH